MREEKVWIELVRDAPPEMGRDERGQVQIASTMGCRRDITAGLRDEGVRVEC